MNGTSCVANRPAPVTTALKQCVTAFRWTIRRCRAPTCTSSIGSGQVPRHSGGLVTGPRCDTSPPHRRGVDPPTAYGTPWGPASNAGSCAGTAPAGKGVSGRLPPAGCSVVARSDRARRQSDDHGYLLVLACILLKSHELCDIHLLALHSINGSPLAWRHTV